MGTFLDLKTRVASELNAGLAPGDEAIAAAIQDAVKDYESHPFWFTAGSDTVSTVASQAVYTIADFAAQTEFAQAVRATIDYGSGAVPMEHWDWGRLIDAASGLVANAGFPRAFAWQGEELRLWPVPTAIYTVTLYGTVLFPALSADTDENCWTGVAERLIRAAALKRLCLYHTQDPERASVFDAAERAELSALTARNTRKVATGRIRRVFL